ncbi:alpha-1,2-fucosyltransferase [Methylovirgula ligni]|uniref:Glycosyl transferase family 11 n=2 Tax=Methylovirgula ligni TaxID=569860 RepID=A0A3D9Z7W7_9HYPH|nr:alpha-1,2-fucosyltransferase [Methylovirgula ligni]QAY95063.1 alpha-1,2-fucosyltransferase [Methylovirgula ligni]REF89659.1 glycosyl transferase family 11 [Methylovirgula ligni]
MIVIRLKGGLGNQMFQYALGRRLALERKVSLWLDLSSFEDRTYAFARDYGLDAFQTCAPRLIARSRLPLYDRVALFLARPAPVLEKAYHALQALPPGRSLCFEGYWQREEYFAPVAETIRKEFQLKAPLAPERQKIAAQYDDSAVSIHVRRGDYVLKPEFTTYFGTCAAEWYGAAIAIIRERVKSPRFFVFSDDPDWARVNLPLREHPVQFIDPRPDKRDAEDLHLMSRCAHHIIANSSFSWWAAWLNPMPDKVIIAPKLWYKGAPEIPVHVPASWLRL